MCHIWHDEVIQVFALIGFERWLESESAKNKAQVLARVQRIRDESHFGGFKYLGGDLFELRWRNGRRVYFALEKKDPNLICLLLLGGFKNDQKKDIKKARASFGLYRAEGNEALVCAEEIRS